MSDQRDAEIIGLRSGSPSERARSTGWLLQNPQQISTRDLMQAIQDESVPRLRRMLLQVLEARQKASVSTPSLDSRNANTETGSPQSPQLPDHADIAALIRHELSGPVGWIRLAAADEIPTFQTSRTNDAVRKLQRRIDGLVAMIKHGEPLRTQRLSLPQVLSDNWAYRRDALRIAPSAAESSIEIDTDEGLFALMLSNIFQNALDAAVDTEQDPDAPLVHVAWGYTELDYWIRVTNRFKGEWLSLEEVVPLGSSSKKAHQGRGLALIGDVAARLGVKISLEGASGTASFTLSGERPR